MGRAQVVQAEAAGIRPHVDMNPILLKPTTDVGSQVIVHGISRGNMKARDYFAMKRSLIPEIMASYERLSNAYDILVIEGAGSPAEINLKSDDIVNMGLAKLVDAPVLLAGDIDRGGVFAQLYGTVALLEQEERKRVKGLIINKFRGDRSILDPGTAMLEQLCGIPVMGVVPYMDVDIEDEDSLSARLDNGQAPGLVDLAVIRLPGYPISRILMCFPGYPGYPCAMFPGFQNWGRRIWYSFRVRRIPWMTCCGCARTAWRPQCLSWPINRYPYGESAADTRCWEKCSGMFPV